MKYDIVVKKREVVLRSLEDNLRKIFIINRQYPAQDECKTLLLRILGSVNTHVTSDFDSDLHLETEDIEQSGASVENITVEYLTKMYHKIRKLGYQYTKLKMKQIKLSAPIHLYEYSKKGFWFKIRHFLLRVGLFIIVLGCALILHLEICFSFKEIFQFDFFGLARLVVGDFFVFLVKLFSMCFLVITVFYANLRIEVKNWYLLEKKTTPLNSLIFYLL